MRADESKTKKERKESKNLISILEKPTASQLCKVLYLLHNFAKPVFGQFIHFIPPENTRIPNRMYKTEYKISGENGILH